MSYKLFLDDERIPNQVKWVEMPIGPWIIVRDYSSFIRHVTDFGLPSFVSFDHDLADEHYPCFEPKGGIDNMKEISYNKYKEKTGYDCAKWLCEYCHDHNLIFPEYQVHSMNPIGRENIRSFIENFKSISQLFKRL